MSLENNKTVKAPMPLPKKHTMLIAVLSMVFAVYSFSFGKIALGSFTAGASLVVVGVYNLVKSSDIKLQGAVLTLITTIIIAGLGTFDYALHAVYPLLVANFAIGGVYFCLQNHIYNWILTNICALAGLLLYDVAYDGIAFNAFVVGMLGLNAGGIMIWILIAEEIKGIERVEEKTNQVNTILGEVSNVASNLSDSSGNMRTIASNLTGAAEDQANYISDIECSIDQFAQSTEECLATSRKASESAARSASVLKDNAENMDKMHKAMEEIEETSSHISSIIKTIDDIAFQTNILALNAAVEAARAGAAGKGFAVVADEVRSLAGKAAEAAQNSNKLINESIAAVHKGSEYAKTTAEQMEYAIQCSNESERYAIEIDTLIANQRVSINNIHSKVQDVTAVVQGNISLAAQSAEVALGLDNEIRRINEVALQQ